MNRLMNLETMGERDLLLEGRGSLGIVMITVVITPTTIRLVIPQAKGLPPQDRRVA
jgi:hypothetical protein